MFGFPIVPKPENFYFKKNFLRSVIFQVKFPNQDVVLKNAEKIVEILKVNYPNKHDLVQNKFEFHIQNKTQVIKNVEVKPQGINFNTKDGNRAFSISEDSITYTINGLNYINFEQFFSEINVELKKLFDLCKISMLNRVAIRKINILEFTINDDIKPVDALGLIFNHSLINSFLSMPGRNAIDKSLSTVNLNQGDFRLNLSYGLLPPQNNINTRNAILDIDLFSQEANCPTKELVNMTQAINREIFNIFSWALQESTQNQLNYGN